MLTALVRLHSALQEVRLPLALPGVEEQRADRAELVTQLEDYLIPRVTTMDGPLLAVVGGSTGAGKSTLVNSIVGRRVTESGVLRPTTRSPVLVHHPADAGWFGQDRLLPELVRVDRPTNDPAALQLVASDAVPHGLAVLDAPDVDSVDASNRALAAELLAAGDLWLFVTSAARYADQVPWELLRQAAERSTSVAVVLDRTDPDDAGTVATHLARMLASRGLKDCPLFTVPETTLTDDGLLPPGAVDDLHAWLRALAADADGRAAVAIRTVLGTIRTLGGRSHLLAGGVQAQIAAAARLRESVAAAYAESVVAARAATADGTMVRGEVLARWTEFVGSGELLRSLEERVGWLRDRLLNAVRGRPQTAELVARSVAVGLGSVLVEHAEVAAGRAAAAWRGDPAGVSLLAEAAARGDDLGRATPTARREAQALAREWQDGLTRMVRAEGSDTRSTTRYLTVGIDGLAVALSVVVLSQSGGTLAVESPSAAPGAGAVAQRLLDAVFGEQAVRSMASRARGDLDRRVEALLTREGARHQAVLDDLGLVPAAPEHLREAARRVDDLRFRSTRGTGGGHGDAVPARPTP
ncbi:dynamin family protein [Nocardioides lentus]|uniref:Dynamin family protein n=1 Tax=Nocardioides lentus TaxID=338077 RepID=A0ABP5AQC3_9ACTN